MKQTITNIPPQQGLQHLVDLSNEYNESAMTFARAVGIIGLVLRDVARGYSAIIIGYQPEVKQIIIIDEKTNIVPLSVGLVKDYYIPIAVINNFEYYYSTPEQAIQDYKNSVFDIVFTTPSSMSPEVLRFAHLMQYELNKNEHKGDWRNFTDKTNILYELQYHQAKMYVAMHNQQPIEKIREYIADCANNLLFLAFNYRMLNEKKDDDIHS